MVALRRCGPVVTEFANSVCICLTPYGAWIGRRRDGCSGGAAAPAHEGPRHGYQLKLELEAATGELWSLNVAQVYSTLQRLERDELVTSEPEDEDGRIPYRLTDRGRDVAADWLLTLEDRTSPSRHELSMKLLLAMVAGIVPVGAVVEARRARRSPRCRTTRMKADAKPESWPGACSWNGWCCRPTRNCAGSTGSRTNWPRRLRRRSHRPQHRGRPQQGAPRMITAPVLLLRNVGRTHGTGRRRGRRASRRRSRRPTR